MHQKSREEGKILNDAYEQLLEDPERLASFYI